MKRTLAATLVAVSLAVLPAHAGRGQRATIVGPSGGVNAGALAEALCVNFDATVQTTSACFSVRPGETQVVIQYFDHTSDYGEGAWIFYSAAFTRIGGVNVTCGHEVSSPVPAAARYILVRPATHVVVAGTDMCHSRTLQDVAGVIGRATVTFSP